MSDHVTGTNDTPEKDVVEQATESVTAETPEVPEAAAEVVAEPAVAEAEAVEPPIAEAEAEAVEAEAVEAEVAVVEPVVPEPVAETSAEATATEAEAAPVVETPAPAEDAEPEAPATATAAAPTPRPKAPKPSRLPKPSPLRRPTPVAPAAAAAPVVVPPVADAAAVAAAEAFGRVDEEGNVFVREAAGERPVGQFPDVPASEAMSLYVRRYLDLAAKVSLFETRLGSADLSVKEIDQTLAKLSEETAEPAAVGDLDALRERVGALGAVAKERRAALEAARAAAKAEAVAARTAIVEAAEKIAATDPARMQWRPAGEELRQLLDQWKEAQRSGPRIDRTSEESLWKRFSHARTAFDRERRHYFAELESRNSSAKTAKEALVAQAEKLSTSTDWGATAGAFRDLMTQWKAAGRAARRDDDALWAKFRAAQDAFFNARDEENAAVDAEYAENLTVKEQILTEAEALVPVKDLNAAKAALRDIQERWEAAGKVPRGDVQRVEGRLRAIEQAVRDAEQAKWDRTNPETRARAEGALAQLEAAIEGLEADLETAKAKGDKRTVGELETAIAARRSWLEQVVRAAEDSRG
ncbi:DUF349 domain-containing protein [Xylanimonas protaetiae]|uniref:DUF349 domain-containing protein n=1 Tax=Xylanimonas protaetiae TaxID=2509457 RepID=A0A4V0YGG4_9MICO|nr:DUF349 domain-containing protein [Xylanimonas protaetiae]QAY71121.1 DUF349 domain-containing protein [Xylanimonas protaetiae]